MLDGFSISGFRSFGPNEVQIGELAKVNLFIGKNNCGKSNVLRAVKRISEFTNLRTNRSHNHKLWDNDVDLCRSADVGAISIGIQLSSAGFTKPQYDSLVRGLNPNARALPGEWPASLWFEFQTAGEYKATARSLSRLAEQLKQMGSWRHIQKLSMDSFGRGGGEGDDSINRFAEQIHEKFQFAFGAQLINAFRRITQSCPN